MKEVTAKEIIEYFKKQNQNINPVLQRSTQSIPQSYQNTYQNIRKPSINYENKKDYSQSVKDMLVKVKEVEAKLNLALIDENLPEAKNYYKELRNLFIAFPDEYYDLKTDIFTDVLSANFRIHELEEHLNKLKKMALDNVLFEQRRKELFEEQHRSIVQEQQQIDKKLKEFEKKIISPVVRAEPIDEVELIKQRARLERLKHDTELLNKRNKSPIKKAQLLLALKRKKQELLKKLYQRGIYELLNKNYESAENYFKQVLKINPEFKPAIIRLEQIKSEA